MIVALLMTTVLLALSMGLVALTNVETAVAANFRRAGEALHAADAGIEIATARLAAADWSLVLAQVEPSACPGPDGLPMAPTAFYPTDRWGPDSVVWRLYDCVRIRDLGGGLDNFEPGLIVAVWLADDPSEADSDPLVDTNRRLTVRAEASGRAGAHAAIDATVARAGPELRILSWRVLR
jgi:hypothetical protein